MSKFSLRSLATGVAAASLLATSPLPALADEAAQEAPTTQFAALNSTQTAQNPLLRNYYTVTRSAIDRAVSPLAASPDNEYEISSRAFYTGLKNALEAPGAGPQVVTGFDLERAAPAWNTPVLVAVARRVGDNGPVAICVEDRGRVVGYFNLRATANGAEMVPAQPLVQPQTVTAPPADGAAAGVCMPLARAERARLRAEYAAAAPRGGSQVAGLH